MAKVMDVRGSKNNMKQRSKSTKKDMWKDQRRETKDKCEITRSQTKQRMTPKIRERKTGKEMQV